MKRVLIWAALAATAACAHADLAAPVQRKVPPNAVRYSLTCEAGTVLTADAFGTVYCAPTP